MTFEEELKELFLEAQAERDQRDKELATFRDGWDYAKLHIIQPAFDQAVAALESYSELSGKVELGNGPICLKVESRKGGLTDVVNELLFSPIELKREVACSYRQAQHAVIENFTLDNLDQRIVERIVKEFLSALLKTQDELNRVAAALSPRVP
jgi:hypothetical protein